MPAQALTPNHPRFSAKLRQWFGFAFIAAILLALIWITLVLAQAMREPRYEGAHTVPVGAIAWQTDLSQGLELARKTGRPALIDFNAVWCEPCEVMKQNIWPDPEIGKLVTEKYIAIYLDVDFSKNEQAVLRYHVGLLPTLLIVDPDGNLLSAANVIDKPGVIALLNGPKSTETRP